MPRAHGNWKAHFSGGVEDTRRAPSDRIRRFFSTPSAIGGAVGRIASITWRTASPRSEYSCRTTGAEARRNQGRGVHETACSRAETTTFTVEVRDCERHRIRARHRPMLFIGLNHDRLPGDDVLRRFTQRSHGHATFDDEQPLRPAVRVPSGARAVCKFIIHVMPGLTGPSSRA